MNYLQILDGYRSLEDKSVCGYWPSQQYAEILYRVAAEIITPYASVLDFGCGRAGLLDYINKNNIECNYVGLDIREEEINYCKQKYPDTTFICCDLLKEDNLKLFDYVIANGVFTYKSEFPDSDMWLYFAASITRLFKHCKKGLAFNVFSKHVDYELDYLFHAPIGDMTNFVSNLTKKFTIRHDYELYQYFVYMYK